jgi:hypothetical protein
MHRTTRFPAALGISALLHIAVLFSLAALNILPAREVLRQIEVNYLKLKPKEIPFGASADPARSRSVQKKIEDELTHKDFRKIIPGQRIILSDKNEVPETGTLFQKPAVEKSEFLNPGAIKLSFGFAEGEGQMGSLSKLHENPAYLTYNNAIRHSVWRSLTNKFFNIHKSSELKDKGLVYLKFTLNRDGSLKEYQVIDEKSRASDELKQIAREGLLDASPFEFAPKELDAQALAFSLVIHFIREEDE